MSYQSKVNQLKIINEYLEKLRIFIERFSPITNSHNCDFIVKNCWDNLIPKSLAADLITLPDDILSILPTGNIFDFEYTHETLMKTEEEGQNVCGTLPSSKVDDVSPKKSIVDVSNVDTEREMHEPSNCQGESKSLKEIIHQVNSFELHNFHAIRSREKVLAGLNSDNNIPFHVSHGMNEKKSHEIEMMTHLCAMLAKFYNINQIVDIGSGKGYLGCQLAMTYDLKVLGVDSSLVNTNSAEIRTKRVEKYWGGLVRKTIKAKLEKDLDKTKGSHGGEIVEPKEDAGNSGNKKCLKDSADRSAVDERSIKKTDTCRSAVDERSSEKADTENNIVLSVQGKYTKHNSKSVVSSEGNSKQSETKRYVPVTKYVTSETDLLQLLQSNFCADGFETADCCEKLNVKDYTHCDDILLTGLHTCGDLGSNILRLFVSNNNVKTVCSVGCCYHLIEEEFVTSPFNSTGACAMPNEAGFPMSKVLRSRKFQLGRNSRMLACQAPERLVENAKLPDRSLYWRALLQVILRDIKGIIRNDWHVGRIAAKCSNFKEYVRKALIKLEIDKHFEDEEIEQYESFFDEYKRKLNAFFQFKALLAPCIETLILLDRWAYVLEQDCTENAHLVQLFDKVISPRCYAVIGTKIDSRKSNNGN